MGSRGVNEWWRYVKHTETSCGRSTYVETHCNSAVSFEVAASFEAFRKINQTAAAPLALAA